MVLLRLCIVIALACGGMATAQPATGGGGLLEKSQSLLDSFNRGMRKFGDAAGGIFGPGAGMNEETKAAHTEERDFHKRLEVGPAPIVSISNEFGEIQVDTWEDRVVQVNAKIAVGAESANVAQEISRSIDVQITSQEGLVQVRPVLPDRHLDMGAVSMQVNLYITVPRGANLVLDNFFGDTYVRGVGGDVALESQFGVVDLTGVEGAVRARVRGEFPLRAQGLKQGGQFQLNLTQAVFSDFGGALQVNSFGGSTQFNTLQPDAEIDVIAESSAIRLVLPDESAPDLTASVVYGSIESALPVTRSEQGRRILARHGSPDARQRIDMSGAFSDIAIVFESGAPGELSGAGGQEKQEYDYDSIIIDKQVTPYTKLQVEGIRGDIQLVATDDPGVHIHANPAVWVASASKVRAALDALPVRAQLEGDRLVVRSLLTGDMEALQCSDYRVTMKIEYPRNLPVTVLAEDGQTQITGSVGTVSVEQTAGTISAADCVGPLNLTNKNGGIRVIGGTGDVTANARYGDTRFERLQGALDVTCVQGDTVIDRPGGAVTVSNDTGNVRILLLDGIGGAFQVFVEAGDLSMVLGETQYADLSLSVDKGTVDSALPLTGQISSRGRSEWKGYPRSGQYSMQLRAVNGDIILD